VRGAADPQRSAVRLSVMPRGSLDRTADSGTVAVADACCAVTGSALRPSSWAMEARTPVSRASSPVTGTPSAVTLPTLISTEWYFPATTWVRKGKPAMLTPGLAGRSYALATRSLILRSAMISAIRSAATSTIIRTKRAISIFRIGPHATERPGYSPGPTPAVPALGG
jgi:hypothetical protein